MKTPEQILEKILSNRLMVKTFGFKSTKEIKDLLNTSLKYPMDGADLSGVEILQLCDWVKAEERKRCLSILNSACAITECEDYAAVAEEIEKGVTSPEVRAEERNRQEAVYLKFAAKLCRKLKITLKDFENLTTQDIVIKMADKLQLR
jgi:hypothetical protein